MIARTYTAAPRSGDFVSDPAFQAWLAAFERDPSEWDKCHRPEWMLYALEQHGASLGRLHACAFDIAVVALNKYELKQPQMLMEISTGDHWTSHEVHAYADALHSLAHAHHLLSHPMSFGAALAADHAISAGLLASPEGRIEGAEEMCRIGEEIVRRHFPEGL